MIKDILIWAGNSNSGLNHPITTGYTFIFQELRDHYNEVLMQSWVKRFRDIFDSDNYHPVQVNTPDEYQKTLEAIPYESSSLEEAPFPKYFPFSNMVVQVYTEVKNFILGCVKFSEDLNLSPAEIDETGVVHQIVSPISNSEYRNFINKLFIMISFSTGFKRVLDQ